MKGDGGAEAVGDQAGGDEAALRETAGNESLRVGEEAAQTVLQLGFAEAAGSAPSLDQRGEAFLEDADGFVFAALGAEHAGLQRPVLEFGPARIGGIGGGKSGGCGRGGEHVIGLSNGDAMFVTSRRPVACVRSRTLVKFCLVTEAEFSGGF